MQKSRKNKILKRVLWGVVFIIIVGIGMIFYANIKIENSTRHLVYNTTENIPFNKVGLLLGTSKYLTSGKENQYYNNRIKATFELFKSQKIQYIVISGDNGRTDYNEPETMKNDLIKLGIPENVIFLDYAGFRTYDSVIRLNEIFGQKSFTIISQSFHNKRAIYISQRLGLKAVGYNAKDVNKYNGFKTNLREKFARVKVFIDFITNKQSKFLGAKIEIK
ncbi:MAG: YdcF family protein [Bacteroidales bacterium]|nr:YdcF family protein [Bacteroidales bacterium]